MLISGLLLYQLSFANLQRAVDISMISQSSTVISDFDFILQPFSETQLSVKAILETRGEATDQLAQLYMQVAGRLRQPGSCANLCLRDTLLLPLFSK